MEIHFNIYIIIYNHSFTTLIRISFARMSVSKYVIHANVKNKIDLHGFVLVFIPPSNY